jgi:hypothetical protein
MLAFAVLGFSACSDNPASPRSRVPVVVGGPNLAAVASTTSDVFPVEITQFVPCANGGAGEVVVVTGNLHEVFTTVISGNGTLVLRSHFQPQGVSGVGLTTGDKYQATGVTELSDVISPPFPVTSTFVNNFRFIGQGPGNNLLVHEVAHLTIDANGVVRVDVDKASVECR